MEACGDKYTKEYKNQISLENSNIPKWVLGQYRNTLFSNTNYTIELKEDAKPYHAKPFPILKIHEPTLKKKVNKLIKIGLL